MLQAEQAHACFGTLYASLMNVVRTSGMHSDSVHQWYIQECGQQRSRVYSSRLTSVSMLAADTLPGLAAMLLLSKTHFGMHPLFPSVCRQCHDGTGAWAANVVSEPASADMMWSLVRLQQASWQTGTSMSGLGQLQMNDCQSLPEA